MVSVAERQLIDHYDEHTTYWSPLSVVPMGAILYRMGTGLVDPVLDLGCGDGRMAEHLYPRKITGVDYSPARVALAKERYRWCDWHVQDAQSFLEENDIWGTILMVDILEHLSDPRSLVDLAIASTEQWVVATVPLGHEYVAHLQVWPSRHAVKRDLEPDRMSGMQIPAPYALCAWKGQA